MKTILLLALVPALAFAAPETIRTSSPSPSPDQFVRFERGWAGDEKVPFQHEEQRLRKLVIRGVEIVLDLEDDFSPVTREIVGSGNVVPTDLQSLTIHAQTVIVRGEVRLPGTAVAIHAHELVFEDDEDRIARIITTPLPYPADAGQTEMPVAEYLKAHPEQHDEWALRMGLRDVQFEKNLNILGALENHGQLRYQQLLPERGDTKASRKMANEALEQYRKGSIEFSTVDINAIEKPPFQTSLFVNWFATNVGRKHSIMRPAPINGRQRAQPHFPHVELPSLASRSYLRGWPKTVSAGNVGQTGLPAGDVTLVVDQVVAAGEDPRFILTGGAGQPGGESGAPPVPAWDFHRTRQWAYHEKYGLPELRPFFAHEGRPLLMPLGYEHEVINGHQVDNAWILQGPSGVKPGRSGAGGPAGNFQTIGLDQSEWASRVQLDPGAPGAAAPDGQGGPAAGEAFFEIRVLSEEQPALEGLEIHEFKGVPNPRYDAEVAEAREEEQREIEHAYKISLDKYREEHPERWANGQRPPRRMAEIDRRTVQWHVQPYRFQLVKREVIEGASTPPDAPESPAENAAGGWTEIPPGEPDLIAIDLATALAREQYLSGATDEATRLCLQLWSQIAYLESPDPELQLRISEVVEMTRNLAAGRDYFGNPPGWTPAGSLDLMLRGYEQTLESSVRTLVTAAYLDKAWSQENTRAGRRNAMLRHFDRQVEADRRETKQLSALIANLESEMERGRIELEDTLDILKASEKRIVSDVELREQFRHEVLKAVDGVRKFTENFAGVSADAFSEMSVSVLGTEVKGAGSMIGFGLDAVNSTVGALAETLEYDINNQPRVPQAQIAAYFEQMLEDEDLREARRELQELDPRNYTAEVLLARLDDIVPPLAAATLRSTRAQIQSQLEQTDEGSRLYQVMFEKGDPYAGLQNGTLQALADVIGALDAGDDAIQLDILNPRLPGHMKKVKQGISKKGFQEQFALITYQFTYRGMLESKLKHARLLRDASNTRQKNLESSIRMLEDEQSGVMASETVADSLQQALREMRRDAENRLLYQKYCLIQAYHHRVLKPCEVTDPVTQRKTPVRAGQLEVMTQTNALLDGVFGEKGVTPQLRRQLGDEWAEYLEEGTTIDLASLAEVEEQLRVIHEQDLLRIAQAIKDEMLNRDEPERKVRRTVLSDRDLEELNRYGEVTIDLADENRNLFFADEVNARLVAIHFAEPDANGADLPQFGDPVWAREEDIGREAPNVKVSCDAADSSVIRWGSKSYEFNYARNEESREVIASFTYNPAGVRLHRSRPWESDSSLLMNVFDISVGELDRDLLKTYKGARTHLTIRKQLPAGLQVDVPIEKLVLWIEIATNESA